MMRGMNDIFVLEICLRERCWNTSYLKTKQKLILYAEVLHGKDH